MNPNFISHYNEARKEAEPKAKPLRGYLDENDYKNLAETKEFLYSEWNLDRLN